MANNSELTALLGQVPIGDLAAKFGVDESTMTEAVQQALPGLVGGLAVNASEQSGAEQIERALQKHTPAPGGLSLDAIDTEDGKKIVKHVLGDKEGDVAHALGANAGNSVIGSLIPKLLPVLAPLVMQFLAGKVLGGGANGTVANQSSSGGGLGGVLGDLLGGLVGGGSQSQSQADAGGGLGDLLGGLLGGGSGSGSSSGGGLGDLLGGLLGGKK